MLKKTTYTKSPSAKNITRELVVIDAKGKVLGRLASEIALILQGKHKLNFVPHLDLGDVVVVVNARHFKVTGRKLEQKVYSKYSGFPGGLKEETLLNLKTRKPEEIIRRAVAGMLPDNKLKKNFLKRLFIFADKNYHLDKEVLAIIKKTNGKKTE